MPSSSSRGPLVQTSTSRFLRKGGARAGSVPPMHIAGGKLTRAGSVPPRSVIGITSPSIHQSISSSSSSSSASHARAAPKIWSVGSSGLTLRSSQPSSSLAASASASAAGINRRSTPIHRRASISGPIGTSNAEIYRASDFRSPGSSSSSSLGTSSLSFGIRSSSSSSNLNRPASSSVYRPSSQAGYGRSSAPLVAKQLQPTAFRRSSISGPGWRSRQVEDEEWLRDDEPAVHSIRVHRSAAAPASSSDHASYYDRRSKPFVQNDNHSKKKVDYESQMNLIRPLQEESLSNLRERTKNARDQLSRHRVLLDRYLPLHLGPENEVMFEVESRYGELLSRMPQLEQRERSRKKDDDNYSSAVFIAPYKPAPRNQSRTGSEFSYANLPAVRNSFTPKVSDTRKRARNVLCKVKGDPRYFDFS